MPLTLPDVRNPHLNSPKIIQINKYSFYSYPRFTLLELIYFCWGSEYGTFRQLNITAIMKENQEEEFDGL